jgi:hypothetical protein
MAVSIQAQIKNSRKNCFAAIRFTGRQLKEREGKEKQILGFFRSYLLFLYPTPFSERPFPLTNDPSFSSAQFPF